MSVVLDLGEVQDDSVVLDLGEVQDECSVGSW